MNQKVCALHDDVLQGPLDQPLLSKSALQNGRVRWMG